MPKMTLNYFDCRARGETARILFALKGKEFKDNRIGFDEWPTLKANTPSGKLPYLENGGEILTESLAINRYLAKEFGFMGKTGMDAAQIDSLVETVNELYKGVTVLALKKAFNQEDKSAALKVEFDSTFPGILSYLEKKVKENKKSSGYLYGPTITVADVLFFSHIDIMTDHEEYKGILNSYPLLGQLITKVKSQPTIQAYLKNRKKTLF